MLASHWWGSAAVFLALDTVRAFDTVSSIRIWSVLDEQDAAGPAALEDMERLQSAVPATLAFQAGRRTWLDEAAARSLVPAIDGRVLEGRAYSPFDVIGLHAATMAPDVRFDLAVGESSSRRRGSGVAAELVVDVEGTRNGAEGRARSTLEFPHGQALLTALGAVLTLSAVMGDDDAAPGWRLASTSPRSCMTARGSSTSCGRPARRSCVAPSKGRSDRTTQQPLTAFPQVRRCFLYAIRDLNPEPAD